MVGVKPAGGIRTSKDAIKFLVAVHEVAGPDWLDNQWFRFGASSLLNDLILQRQKMKTAPTPAPTTSPTTLLTPASTDPSLLTRASDRAAKGP
jgi:hypothetical protein